MKDKCVCRIDQRPVKLSMDGAALFQYYVLIAWGRSIRTRMLVPVITMNLATHFSLFRNVYFKKLLATGSTAKQCSYCFVRDGNVLWVLPRYILV